jgi:hypothetical protein
MPTLNFARVQHAEAMRQVRRLVDMVQAPDRSPEQTEARLFLQAEFIKWVGEPIPTPGIFIVGMFRFGEPVATQVSKRIYFMMAHGITDTPNAIY